MSASANTATVNVAELDSQLNNQILSGDILNAFERFYADDVVMQENTEEPRVGKSLNREYEQKFLDSVEAFHSAKLLSGAVNGDVTFSEWEYDVTIKGVGRNVLTQVAVRRWKNGQIIHERFYYKK